MQSLPYGPKSRPVVDSDGDAYGRAALLLVESLIHGLAARSIISAAEAVSIMEVALDAQIAIGDDTADPTPAMQKAATLLSSLMASLAIDVLSLEKDA